MINYREILFLSYEKKMGSREIAASVRCSKSAVNEFLSRFERCDRNLLSYPLGEDVTNERIREVLYKQQGNISKRQREYNRTVHELHDQADQLRSALEVLTARQKQQMKEAVAVAKRFADEKKRFVSMHRELEMLNAELVRETVEHETLMKEVSKMDSYLLSQMSAGASSKLGTSMFSSIRASRF